MLVRGTIQGINSSPPAYLCHQSVRTRVLFILEDNVRIVVRSQLLKPLRVPRDLALVSATGPQRLLSDVRDELFVRQWGQFLRVSPVFAESPARSARQAGGRQGDADESRQHKTH